MAKPAILCVDDDPQVLRAVDRDLRQKYGETYRILRAESGEVGSRHSNNFNSARSRSPFSLWISGCPV